MEKLSSRMKDVLRAVIRDYIASAEPVSSTQVARKKGMRLSSATIRTVMAELEEKGYLNQPHASSGRIPTSRAYRVYVKELMNPKPLSKEEKLKFEKCLGSGEIEEIVFEACRFISQCAQQVCVMLKPREQDSCLQEIRLFHLKGNLVLIVLVLSSGAVENKILRLNQVPNQSKLDQIHHYLTDRLSGLPMRLVRRRILAEIETNEFPYHELLDQVSFLSDKILSKEDHNVHIEGRNHLLNSPEFLDSEKMQLLLKTLEEKSQIVWARDCCMSHPGVNVFIGQDLPYFATGDLTLISSTYRDFEGNFGLLGVLGPTRMDYDRIVPLVEDMSNMLSTIWSNSP